MKQTLFTLVALAACLVSSEESKQLARAQRLQCDTECLSYCTYYYPSDECTNSCNCGNNRFGAHVSHQMQQRTRNLAKLTQTAPLQPVDETTTAETTSDQTSTGQTTVNLTTTGGTTTTQDSESASMTTDGTDQTSVSDSNGQTTTTTDPIANDQDTTTPSDGIDDSVVVEPVEDGTTPDETNPSDGSTDDTIQDPTDPDAQDDGGDTTPTDGQDDDGTTTPTDDETSTGDGGTTDDQSTGTGGDDGETTDPVTDPTTDPVTDPTTDDDTDVDPQIEESKQTCIATCGLKCKSESSDKKDACIDLCYNQCTASIALYVEEQERPLLRLKNQKLLSLSQQQQQQESTNQMHNRWDDRYLEDDSASKLRMDDFMSMKLQQSLDDAPECTTACVAHCGRLAELPRTEAAQLVGCFKETCGCRSKYSPQQGGASDDDDTLLMRQYFDMIHNQERVEYLMLQQNVIDQIVSLESAQSAPFLASGDSIVDSKEVSLLKQKLNTEDGVKYYEQYLGEAKNRSQDSQWTFQNVMLHLTSSALVTAAIVVICYYLLKKYLPFTQKNSEKISFDCDQAILKKQRLEQTQKK